MKKGQIQVFFFRTSFRVTNWGLFVLIDKSSLTPLRQKQKGYTLLELLLVGALALILVALGAPSFRDIQAKSSSDSQAAALRTTLRLGRDEAIRTRGDVVLCPSLLGRDCDSSDWSDGWLLFHDAAPAAAAAGEAGVSVGTGDTVIRHTAFIGSHTQLLASLPMIRFDSRGRSQIARFVFCPTVPMGGVYYDDEIGLRLNLAGITSEESGVELCGV